MNLYDATVPLFTKFLSQVESWLDKAVADAETRKYDPEILLIARLAPDQYPLVRQLQAACDQAKSTVAKMTGQEVPVHPDTETTIAEIRARIATVKTYLATFSRADFEGCEEREVTYAFLGGKHLRAGDFLDHLALPNFHFHLVTAYSILRHNGIPVGKTDFIGSLPLR